MPAPVYSWWIFARTLGLAFLGGLIAHALHLPLPWLLGALLPCALLRLRGVRLGSPPFAQAAGQWVIGTALGMYFTPSVLLRVGAWAPWIALAVLWSFALGGFLSWALVRWGAADPATAYWSGPIGAAAEMVLQGERAGARVDLVAAAHSLRLLLVVILVPLTYDRLGLHGSDRYFTGARTVEPTGLLVLIMITVGAALLVRRLRGPNPWMLGSLVGALALTASGNLASALPAWVSPLGQLLIGISLGGRFGPGFFGRAPRFLAVVGVVTLGAMASSAALAALIGWAAHIPLATIVLATAPGGIAEMCLTAQALQLGVPVVTAFHATRVVALLLVVQGGWVRSRQWLASVRTLDPA